MDVVDLMRCLPAHAGQRQPQIAEGRDLGADVQPGGQHAVRVQVDERAGSRHPAPGLAAVGVVKG